MLTFKRYRSFVVLFLLPALFFYVVFELYPAVQGIGLSFQKWTGVATMGTQFVGIKNYIQIFHDSVFWLSVKNLVFLLIVSLLTQLPIAFVLAYLLSQKLRGTTLFKVSFFLPIVLSSTAISLMWKLIMSDNYGLLNALLQTVGLSSWKHAWLTDPQTSFTVMTLINSWQQVGYFMIILLAGISAIPEEIFEALKLDGARDLTIIFKIVLPIIKDVIGVCVVLILTTSIKSFDIIYVMTSGTFGPNNVNQVPIGLMYYRSFVGNNFGQGSAVSTLILLFGSALASLIYIKGFQEKSDQ